MCINPKYCESRAPLPHYASRIDRSKGFLQIHAGCQARDFELGKMAFQGSAQPLLIGGTGRPSDRRSSTVAFAANLQLGWPRLSQPLHSQPQRAILDFSLEHAPHRVSLG